MTLVTFKLLPAIRMDREAPALRPRGCSPRLTSLLTVLRCTLTALSLTTLSAHAAPSIAQFGQPRYPAGFTHFDYANPDAPAGGTLNFGNYDELQSYDSLNPFLLRGTPAPDIRNLMFDTLMQRSWDEVASEYPLIADDVEVQPDFSAATFHINPAARFSNGDRITAADVKYSFDTLASPQVSPLFKATLKKVNATEPSIVRCA